MSSLALSCEWRGAARRAAQRVTIVTVSPTIGSGWRPTPSEVSDLVSVRKALGPPPPRLAHGFRPHQSQSADVIGSSD